MNSKIKNLLDTFDIKFKEKENGYVLKICPLCEKPHNDDSSKIY